MKNDSGTGSSTLIRALTVLDLLYAAASRGLTAAQIADQANMNRVTVHRILTTFKARGFVRQDRPGEPWRLGFKLVELAQGVLSESNLVRLAQPLLEELAERAGETCHLAVLDGAEAVYVAKEESSHAVRLVSRVGARLPLYASGLGKALLAWMDEEQAERFMELQTFERRTDMTIIRPELLRAELTATRERGYAVDLGENEPGVRCVAAPVLDPNGRPLAAISVSGPDWRLPPESLDDLGRLVAASSTLLAETIVGKRDGKNSSPAQPEARRVHLR